MAGVFNIYDVSGIGFASVFRWLVVTVPTNCLLFLIWGFVGTVRM
jgi:hypothetical protein